MPMSDRPKPRQARSTRPFKRLITEASVGQTVWASRRADAAGKRSMVDAGALAGLGNHEEL